MSGPVRRPRRRRRSKSTRHSRKLTFVSLGIVKGFYDWDRPEAEREFKSAIALNPGLADAYHWHYHYLQAMDRLDEALSEIRHAVELDPLSPVFGEDVALAYFYRRENDQSSAVTQNRPVVVT